MLKGLNQSLLLHWTNIMFLFRFLDVTHRYRNFKLFGYQKTFILTQSHDEPTLHLAHVNLGADAGTCVVVEVAPGKIIITKIIIMLTITCQSSSAQSTHLS